MGRAKGQSGAVSVASRHQAAVVNSAAPGPVLRNFEETCRYCYTNNSWEAPLDRRKCQHCHNTGVITTPVTQELLDERKEALVAAIEQQASADRTYYGGLTATPVTVDQALLGAFGPHDGRDQRIVAAFVDRQTNDATADAQGYLRDVGVYGGPGGTATYKTAVENAVVKLFSPEFRRDTGSHASENTQAFLERDMPRIAEATTRMMTAEALASPDSVSFQELSERIRMESRDRAIALRLSALEPGERDRNQFGSACRRTVLQDLIGSDRMQAMQQELCTRPLLRDRALEKMIDPEDIYLALKAGRQEGVANPDFVQSSYYIRHIFGDKLPVMMRARLQAENDKAAPDPTWALAEAVRQGKQTYERRATGSTTFEIWQEEQGNHSAPEPREFDSANPDSMYTATEYVKTLKDSIAQHNQELVQQRHDRLNYDRESFRHFQEQGLDGALREGRAFSAAKPTLDSQTAIQLLDDL